MKKIYNSLFKINVLLLVLGAIFAAIKCPLGLVVLLETCLISAINAWLNGNFNGKIINGALGAIVLYYSIVTIVNLF